MNENVCLGAYVTASQVELAFTEDYPDGLHEPRQGVLIRDNGDGTVVLRGEAGTYLCFDTGVRVVPDRNLSEKTYQFVLAQRHRLYEKRGGDTDAIRV